MDKSKEIEQFVELLYPYFKKKLIADGTLKNYVKRKNATVVSVLESGTSNIGKEVEVILPYDTTSFFVRNETGVDLNKGNLICLEYVIDLKNAVAVYKVN